MTCNCRWRTDTVQLESGHLLDELDWRASWLVERVYFRIPSILGWPLDMIGHRSSWNLVRLVDSGWFSLVKNSDFRLQCKEGQPLVVCWAASQGKSPVLLSPSDG